MIWATVGRAAKAVLGDSVEIQSDYDYEDVVQAFDF